MQGGNPYVSQALNNALIYAEDEAKRMGDEYVSVEHIFLSLIDRPNKEVAELFREYGFKRRKISCAMAIGTSSSDIKFVTRSKVSSSDNCKSSVKVCFVIKDKESRASFS